MTHVKRVRHAGGVKSMFDAHQGAIFVSGLRALWAAPRLLGRSAMRETITPDATAYP
jgi:hypothetical protein